MHKNQNRRDRKCSNRIVTPPSILTLVAAISDAMSAIAAILLKNSKGAKSMTKITFLGTNGFYPTDLGDTVCVLIETDKYNLILDAGSGLSKLDQFDCQQKPTYIFLSHLHLDHISGLFTLPKLKFNAPLQILVSEASCESLLNILKFPYMCPLELLSYKTEILKLESVDRNGLPFEVDFLPVVHSVHTLGYKFLIEGKIISYVTDTGICDNALTLAKNADLLILECSHLSGEINKGWPHINPQEAAEVAIKSQVRKLVLSHFDSNRYRTIELRKKSLEIIQSQFPNAMIATDLLTIEL